MLATLEELARRRRIPTTFADQVDTGLRLLADQATLQHLEGVARQVPVHRHTTVGLYDQLPRLRPTTADDSWQRDDGPKWTQIQSPAIDPSGQRRHIPLLPPGQLGS